jgi:DNA ligase-1
VSRLLVTRALAAHAGLDPKTVAQRLIGYTNIAAQHDADAFRALIAPEGDARGASGHPYPFFLAHQLNADPSSLGAPQDWIVEWKWTGIRAQLVARGGEVWVWSRGEELVTDRFPEIAALGARLPPGTVVDGEIVAWRDDVPSRSPPCRRASAARR